MKKVTDSPPGPETPPRTPGAFIRALAFLDRQILRGWRVFVSLKFGLALLALIGVLAIYGTMGFASNAALGDNAIPMARAKFFETPWFNALLVLFAFQLMISTWHVTTMAFTIWGKKDFRRGPSYYSAGSAPRAVVQVPGGPDEAERLLRRRYRFFHRDGDAFYAQKGILSRVGPTVIHAGIILVIGSTVAKSFLIYTGRSVTEGRFLAAEGETTNLIHEPIDLAQQITDKNRKETALDLWIRVLDFDEVKHPNSQTPAYFSSLVEVRDPNTQEITVAQLDMNHSLRLNTSRGVLQFHQSGYQALQPSEGERINLDVRDRRTGERIAVTDAQSDCRVRVGDTEYFLEVDGVTPASRWRMYSGADPLKPVAQGLLDGGKQLTYSFQALEFYPNFRIDETKKTPTNLSNEPRNPALKVAIFLDDRKVEETWLFLDQQLAALVPDTHPKFSLKLEDIQVPQTATVEGIEWNRPGEARFVVALIDKTTGSATAREFLTAEQKSKPYQYTTHVAHDAAALGSEGDFTVRLLGPTTKFITVLSVVNEPTVLWTNLGVLIIVIGAGMTFATRYRAFHGWWDAERGLLHIALVPRWGQLAVREEFDALVQMLSHGKGPVVTTGSLEPDEADPPPQHMTTAPAQATP